MAPKETVRIDGVHFKDDKGRVLVLRGLNVGGNTKQPTSPHIPSHVRQGFLDGDQISFVGRPFPLHEAHQHLSRIKGYGYNVIRFLTTWEAIEHAGPRIYDDEYVDYVVALLRKCRDHGFLVFIDPHQDVWSRFSGGSGAPLWTLYACGFDPANFTVTEAALTHNFSDDPQNYPKMVWSTNYHRLVSYTMFTLFFAGREYAPKAMIDGINIQDFLESHYLDALRYLAQKIHDADDLEDVTVIGWENINEPSIGMVGYTNLDIVMPTQQLRKTTCPSAFQCMLLGEGVSCKIDVYDWTRVGPRRIGSKLVDPRGLKAWIASDIYDKRYGWDRDPGWKLGECLWAQHGVWDSKTRKLLRPDYFLFNNKGEEVDNDIWLRDHFMVHFRRYSETPPVMFIPPILTPASRDRRLVFSPHYYDGLTLMLKKWNWWNIDALGYLRGKYRNPLMALRIGYTAIRNSLRDQLIATKEEGLDNIGETPCLLSEIGIPYDMDNKRAYTDGTYTSQYSAMDANNYALEAAGLSYTLWNYCADNQHTWGDLWNGEDLSVWSASDVYRHPQISLQPSKIQSTEGATNERLDMSASNSLSDESANSTCGLMTRKPFDWSSAEASLTSFCFPYIPSLNEGSRAFEAFVRPSPIVVAGIPKAYGFDMRTCSFSLSMVPLEVAPAENSPTEIFLPEYFFQDCEPEISVSSGRWIMYRPGQILRWWHSGKEEQKLTVSSAYRKQGVVGIVNDDVEGWYYGYGKCQIM